MSQDQKTESTHDEMNETRVGMNSSQSNPSDDPLTKFVAGKFGLAKTYWVYGVLAGFVWAAAAAAISRTDGTYTANEVALTYLDALKNLMFLYYFFVYIGIWNAANKYKGNPIWATLAKFVVVLVAVPSVIMALKHLYLI